MDFDFALHFCDQVRLLALGYLPQGSWGAAGSLCHTVNYQGKRGTHPPEAKKLRRTKNNCAKLNSYEKYLNLLLRGGFMPNLFAQLWPRLLIRVLRGDG